MKWPADLLAGYLSGLAHREKLSIAAESPKHARLLRLALHNHVRRKLGGELGFPWRTRVRGSAVELQRLAQEDGEL